MTTPTLPPRDDPGTTTLAKASGRCPVCMSGFTPVGRQAYCTTACRKTAFRRRHHTATTPVVPAGTHRRDVSAYQCDTCGERQLGQQRCPDCNTFGAALGLAGTCPHCDGIIGAADLDQST